MACTLLHCSINDIGRPTKLKSSADGALEQLIMTVRELARYLRVHPATVYRLLKHEQIPGFRVVPLTPQPWPNRTLDARTGRLGSARIKPGVHDPGPEGLASVRASTVRSLVGLWVALSPAAALPARGGRVAPRRGASTTSSLRTERVRRGAKMTLRPSSR